LSYIAVYEDIGRKDYKEAWDYQAGLFRKLIESKKQSNGKDDSISGYPPGTLIFVEHPHVYTLGRSGSEKNLLINAVGLKAKNAAFYRIDRGGDITYHGPGQIVGYPIFDLEVLKIGVKEYIYRLEEAIIRTVGEFGLAASRLRGGTGVWFDPDTGSARKICAIGVKASRFVTMHGFAFNVNTDLSYFDIINPCGFKDKGVTSLARELNADQDINYVKEKIKNNLQMVFNLKWVNI
jgi:lipoyl(octanoyl) transferase